MQLGNQKYFQLVEQIVRLYSDMFGKDMLLIGKWEAFEQMGYFKIKYKYLPFNYDVVFESDRDMFVIDIFDDEGAKNTLYRLEEFSNETTLENIKFAIQKLKKVLINNNFCFYISRGEKMYRKEGKQYKRIKDLTELATCRR